MSRIGGFFPFPPNTLVIELGGGGAYYLPPGNWLVSTGFVTVLQWFNPLNEQWVGTIPSTDPTYLSSDGANYRLVNMSGIVQAANITNAGSGGTNGIGAAATGVSVSFGAAPANGQAASAYPIVGGALSSPTITQVGTGFVVPPLILIDPPPLGGIQAVAIATITTAGVLNAVSLIN